MMLRNTVLKKTLPLAVKKTPAIRIAPFSTSSKFLQSDKQNFPGVEEGLNVVGLNEKSLQNEEERMERIRRREELRAAYREKMKNIKQKAIAEDDGIIPPEEFLTHLNTQKKYEYATKVFYHSRFVEKKPMQLLPKAIVPKDLEEGLQIQKKFIELAESNGKKVQGWKIGATTGEAIKRRNIPYPFVGAIFETNANTKLDQAALKPWVPFVECEIGFILKKDFTPVQSSEDFAAADTIKYHYSREEIINNIEYIVPVLELVGSRMEDGNVTRYGAKALQVDCGGNVALILGKPITPAEYLSKLGAQEGKNALVNALIHQEVNLSIGGKKITKATGVDVTTGWVSDGPVGSMTWFVNYATSRGITIKKGQVISSGTMTGKDLFDVSSANEATGDFGSVLGKVTIAV